MRIAADLVAGQQEELGRLLSDSQTRQAPLAPTPGSAVRYATFAWNDEKGQGALFCDQLEPLPAGSRYQIWAGSTESADATRLAELDARPGVAVYPFSLPRRLGPTPQLRLTIALAANQAVDQQQIVMSNRGK
jgi:hypothetical protein